MDLWIPGGITPELRMEGFIYVTPMQSVPHAKELSLDDAWPRAESLSLDDASNFVFQFLRALPREYHAALIPQAERDRIASLYNNQSWDYVYGHPGMESVYASVYLNIGLVGAPLPDDLEYVSKPGDLAYGWPSGTDTLTRAIYQWGIRTLGWDGYVPRIRVGKNLQIQKWSAQEAAWKIYNQNGTDLVFVQDPISKAWTAGFDFQEWLNEHGREIFTAWQIVYGVVSSVVGAALGGSTIVTAIAGVQQAMDGLAQAAAKGDLGSILKAIGGVLDAVGAAPGGAEIGRQFQAAGEDVIKVVLANPVVQQGVVLANEAQHGIEAFVAKANALKKQFQTTIEMVNNVRASMVPTYLLPWFDKAVSLGPAALPLRDGIPWYAKGVWDMATGYGTLTQASIHVVKGQSNFKPWELASNAQVAALSLAKKPAPTVAEQDLLAYCQGIRGRYGV